MPPEGNFYPAASAAVIEDGYWRLSMLTGQPGGVTSRGSGNFEVMIDRRPVGNDGKGLDQWDATDVGRFSLLNFQYFI